MFKKNSAARNRTLPDKSTITMTLFSVSYVSGVNTLDKQQDAYDFK